MRLGVTVSVFVLVYTSLGSFLGLAVRASQFTEVLHIVNNVYFSITLYSFKYLCLLLMLTRIDSSQVESTQWIPDLVSRPRYCRQGCNALIT